MWPKCGSPESHIAETTCGSIKISNININLQWKVFVFDMFLTWAVIRHFLAFFGCGPCSYIPRPSVSHMGAKGEKGKGMGGGGGYGRTAISWNDDMQFHIVYALIVWKCRWPSEWAVRYIHILVTRGQVWRHIFQLRSRWQNFISILSRSWVWAVHFEGFSSSSNQVLLFVQ